jgi:iron complex outermembrane receptor protein/hemoglobin/transferrin/lactoferrin receptor protein
MRLKALRFGQILLFWLVASGSLARAEEQDYVGPASYQHGPIVVYTDRIYVDAQQVRADLVIVNVSTRPISYDPHRVLLRVPGGATVGPQFEGVDGGASEPPVALAAGAFKRTTFIYSVALAPYAKAVLVFGGFEEEGRPVELPDFPIERAPPGVASKGEVPTYESFVNANREAARDLPAHRAVSTVRREDIERHQPGSTPEALAYEPGVFITQSGHGRSSAYIRGLTGQQTVTLFDGIRINNSTYRPGPSQYLFTVDPQTVDHIELLRGGASTQFGSDAIGGVVLVEPINPALPEPAGEKRYFVKPGLRVHAASADRQIGGRVEVEAGLAQQSGLRLGFFGGVGGRSLGLLESAGSVENPNPNTTIGRYPLVPRFAPDGRTQLGTGFKELTADGRLILQLPSRGKVTLAAYLYRQYDAPKTDRCPAPYAPYNSCLTYEEQFRHLVYGAYEPPPTEWMEQPRFTVSFQVQNERQRLEEPLVYSIYRSLDRVHTVGVAWRARTRRWRIGPELTLNASYGLDTYYDWVTSSASLSFTNVMVERTLTRGQYLGGARYLYGGVFINGELTYRRRLTFRAGGRLSWFGAWAPQDPESSTQAVRRSWVPVVGSLGLEWRALPALSFLANADQSFRAPNLDDLTGRLQIGPGFQFENPSLRPERATTFEVGTRLRTLPVVLDAWIFEMLIQDAITKVPRSSEDCPANSSACQAAWSIFGLQNAPGRSEMRGVEGAVSSSLPLGFSARATLSYTWGEGPRLGTLPREPAVVLTGSRIPLSTVPPLNGIVELIWNHRSGFGINADLRWAAMQSRLSLADYKDADIPKYGTPGYAILNAGAVYRLPERLKILFRIENLVDTPYRRHGSSVNGAGRNFMLTIEATL